MDAKIAGGSADDRAAMSAQMAEQSQADVAMRAAEDMKAQESAAKAAANLTAMAAVERAEAERTAAAAAEKPPESARPKASNGAAQQVLDEAQAIRERAEAERARLERLGDEYEVRLRRERDRDRVSALRSMGAIAAVSDVQLLMISPDVDPETASGRAELDIWREGNAGLFHRAAAPRLPSADEMIGTLNRKQSPFGHYGPEYFAELMTKNLARGDK